MKYLITMVLIVHGGLTLAEQFKSWEEHTLAAMEARLESQNRQLLGVVATVGTDVACDFRVGTTKIQDAIDSGANDIRVVTDTYTENLVIDDISVSITGGFANCTDASNNVSDGSQVTVDGGGAAAPTVQITGNTQRNTVDLSNFIFQGGTGSGFLTGGGISTLTADLQLNLNNVWVSGNTGTLGGGLAIVAGDTDVSGIDFLVVSNNADEGGGIYCSSGDASIFMADENNIAGVFNNSATNGDGGGVLLQSGCVFTTYAGTDGGFLDLRGVASNSATGNGGGLAVESGSSATLVGFQFCFFGCIGNNTEPLNVNSNAADSDNDNVGFGGGVYVTGTDSNVSLFNGLVESNTAQDGAAVASMDSATFETRYINTNCWSPGSCNQYRDNIADSRGGAFYLDTGGTADIAQSYIQGNQSTAGVVAYIRDTGSSADVEGNVITNNGDSGNALNDNYIFRTFSDGDITMTFNTIADNELSTSTLGHDGGTMNMLYNIIHDPGRDVFQGAGTLVSICNLVNEDASLSGDVQTVVDDPEFVNRAGGDFHLNASISPAVDLCQQGFFPSDYTDIDLQDRGLDDPLATNINGPWDAGADETYDNEIIFEDDFEG